MHVDVNFGEHTQQEGFPAEHEKRIHGWKHAAVLTPVMASWLLYPTQANPFSRNPGMPQENGSHHLWDRKWCARHGEINTVIRWGEKVKYRVTKNHWNPLCHVKKKRKGRKKESAFLRSQICTHCWFPSVSKHTLAVYKLLLIWGDDQEVQL